MTLNLSRVRYHRIKCFSKDGSKSSDGDIEVDSGAIDTEWPMPSKELLPRHKYQPEGFQLITSELREDPITALRTIRNQLRECVVESAQSGRPIRAQLCQMAYESLTLAEADLERMQLERTSAIVNGNTEMANALTKRMRDRRDRAIFNAYVDLLMDRKETASFGIQSDWAPKNRKHHNQKTETASSLYSNWVENEGLNTDWSSGQRNDRHWHHHHHNNHCHQNRQKNLRSTLQKVYEDSEDFGLLQLSKSQSERGRQTFFIGTPDTGKVNRSALLICKEAGNSTLSQVEVPLTSNDPNEKELSSKIDNEDEKNFINEKQKQINETPKMEDKLPERLATPLMNKDVPKFPKSTSGRRSLPEIIGKNNERQKSAGQRKLPKSAGDLHGRSKPPEATTTNFERIIRLPEVSKDQYAVRSKPLISARSKFSEGSDEVFWKDELPKIPGEIDEKMENMKLNDGFKRKLSEKGVSIDQNHVEVMEKIKKFSKNFRNFNAISGERDVKSSANICPYCNKRDPCLENESYLRMHFAEQCVLLSKCEFCDKIIETYDLNDHQLKRCPFVSKELIACEYCGLARYPDEENHPRCRGALPPEGGAWCPLCSALVTNEESRKEWLRHLATACYNNPRNFRWTGQYLTSNKERNELLQNLDEKVIAHPGRAICYTNSNNHRPNRPRGTNSAPNGYGELDAEAIEAETKAAIRADELRVAIRRLNQERRINALRASRVARVRNASSDSD